MNPTFHQELNVNSFKTERRDFTSELYLQGLILMNPHLLSLNNDTHSDPVIFDNEAYIKSDEKSGRIDLLANYDNNLGVIELKNVEINKKAVTQLQNYISSIVDKIKLEKINEIEFEDYFGVLVGPAISSDTLKLIEENNSDNSKNKIYVIIIERFVAFENRNSFILSRTINYVGSTSKRDYTKYTFAGKNYGKGRFVLAVIKEYVSKSPTIKFNELKTAFPDTLQGAFGCFQKVSDIEKQDRYFMKEDEIIQVDNITIAVSTEWGIKNIGNFEEKCKSLKINFIKTNK